MPFCTDVSAARKPSCTDISHTHWESMVNISWPWANISSARLSRSANTSMETPASPDEWRNTLHNLLVGVFFFLLAQLVTRCEASLNLRVFCDQRWIGGLPINKPNQVPNPEGFFGISTV